MRSPFVYLTVLAIATCGLVYELVAGTLASYLLGDSVTQFSTVIGVYLFALGVGSWLSRFVERGLARRFVEVELAVALAGGVSAPFLFLAFAQAPSIFRPALYGVVLLVGTLVGLEIPLVLRLLKETVDFRELVARVLAFDYVGALFASLLFPIVLVPHLGIVRTSLAFGFANALVGLWSTWLFAPLMGSVKDLRIKAVAVLVLLAAAFAAGDRFTALAEENLFADPVILARSSPYQRIVLTKTKEHFQLFLNGNLQFSSADEYRYHEALVHPPMALRPGAKRALVLGGGDGLALRELLRYPSIEEITLVDLDPEMVRIARENPLLRDLNGGSFASPKVRVVNQDAYVWLHEDHGQYDIAIVDFPDPNNFSLGKLYTTRFYRLLRRALAPGAPVAVQSTSPLMARSSFWCIVRTMEQAGFATRPYHAFVPSFGEWGFVLARDLPFEVPRKLEPGLEGLRYLTDEMLPQLFIFSKDMGPLPVQVNRLDNQILVQYYESEWARWN